MDDLLEDTTQDEHDDVTARIREGLAEDDQFPEFEFDLNAMLV